MHQTDIRLKSTQVTFPIHAYLFVINDFLNHGYYRSKEQIYKRTPSGKISWSRTIKQVRPQIANENAVYLEFITHRTNHNEAELITLIHKFCVYESFCKLGFLFLLLCLQSRRLRLTKTFLLPSCRQKSPSLLTKTNFSFLRTCSTSSFIWTVQRTKKILFSGQIIFITFGNSLLILFTAKRTRKNST